MDYTIEKMISEGDLQARIREVAKEIEKDYEGKDLICVGLLKVIKWKFYYVSHHIKAISNYFHFLHF